MFEGDMIDGELEIGQVSGTIDKIMPAKDIVDEIITEFFLVIKSLEKLSKGF